MIRPLGGPAYGSIPHLPGSRTGPADKHLAPARARCLLERRERPGDRIIVEEKLDGSCVAAARIGGEIFALGREGSLAAALRSAFETRGDPLALTGKLMAGTFGTSPWSLRKWGSFRASRPDGQVPEDHTEVIAEVAAILRPIVEPMLGGG